MTALKKLIHEVHRRSLWQVMGIFLAASWGVLQVVEVLTETAGLPDWTPTFALVLLLIGLPICLATAFVQEGMPGQEESAGPVEATGAAPGAGAAAEAAEPAMAAEGSAPANLAAGTGSLDRPSTRPSKTKRLLTWRNAILGGGAAFALLGFTVVAYWIMWTTGIGPVGNLVAQGVFEEGERVVLATFDDATGEGLGEVVTEALRVDLNEAEVLSLVEDVDIAPVLARMQLEPGTPLTGQLAREVALREGIKAVIEGDVAAAGTGYLVTATLRATDSGRSIASFRVAADGPDEVIASIDKLSQDIREKSGESLRSIRAGEPLEDVTTRSTEALRLYTESDKAWDAGDERRTIELLEQAVELDPEFAMAWRRMAALLNNMGTDPVRRRQAATQAFQHRNRLTERERYLAEAFYYSEVASDRGQTIAAYQNVLRIDPDDRSALNNLANEYMSIQDFDRARELYRRAVDGPGRSNTAYQNLIRNRIGADDFQGAMEVYREYEAAYPEDATLPFLHFWAAFVNGDLETARAAVEPFAEDPAVPAYLRTEAHARLGDIAYQRGRLDEGRRHYLAAERAAEDVGESFLLTRRQWTGFNEMALGDGEWGSAHARSVLEDGLYEATDPTARDYFFIGLNLARMGDGDGARRMLEEWRAAMPEEFRHANALAQMDRLAIYIASLEEGGEGHLAAHRAAAEEHDCLGCWPLMDSWLAGREGKLDEAARILDGVRGDGQNFLELNGPWRLAATVRLGPVYEEAGDTAGAIEAYRRLVELWSDADARGMEKVRHARERIEALGG